MAARHRRPRIGAERALRALALAERLGSVAEACRRAGASRDSFYRLRRRYRELGEVGLRSRLPLKVDAAILGLARPRPMGSMVELSQRAAARVVSARLRRTVSPTAVRNALLRRDFAPISD